MGLSDRVSLQAMMDRNKEDAESRRLRAIAAQLWNMDWKLCGLASA